MASTSTFVSLDASFLVVLFYLTARTNASPLTHSHDPVNLVPRWTRPWQNETGSEIFRAQMENPSEVFSVLLIIGGDIIRTAVAQMSGRRLTFVAFSFGWVAYAFGSLMSAFGDGNLMPEPEFSSEVINVKSGIKKQNNSWVLCRLVRDLEREITKKMGTWYEKDDQTTTDDWVDTVDDKIKCNLTGEASGSLLVTICTALPGAAKPQRDWSFIIYLTIILIQHIVAMIPTILYGNWSVLFITFIGTCLAFCTTSLREWRLEKYQARRHSNQMYVVTRGNGHRHVFVIKEGRVIGGKYPGLFLDDLAGAVRKADKVARFKTVCLAILWVMFLITAGGLKDHTWFLMLVGLIGMAQNIWVAARHQSSEAHGIPVDIGTTYGLKSRPHPNDAVTRTTRGAPVYEFNRAKKVMRVLMEVEKDYPKVGAAMRPEFFPEASLDEDEIKWWGEAKTYVDELKAHTKDPQKNRRPASIKLPP